MKGPAIYIAHHLGDEPPFDHIDSIAPWASGLGYRGLQVPSWDLRAIDIALAASSTTYCEDYVGRLAEHGLALTELAAYIPGQALALHPVFRPGLAELLPPSARSQDCEAWGRRELELAIDATRNCGLDVIPSLSGTLAWHLLYPFPPRPLGVIKEAFRELARRWLPLLDRASESGAVIAFELHPAADLFDGATWELFLEAVDDHHAAALYYDPSHFLLQQLDYLGFIRRYGDRIRGFHVKDAEFIPSARMGVYGGYGGWAERAGRFRSPGDGQIDFKQVFSLLVESGFEGWAVLEWECPVKSSRQGAAEGAPFIARHMIERREPPSGAASPSVDAERNRRALGLAPADA